MFIKDASYLILILIIYWGEKRLQNHKDIVKRIIERMTERSISVFSEAVFDQAGEVGLGESQVEASIRELMEEHFLEQPCRGVLRRAI